MMKWAFTALASVMLITTFFHQHSSALKPVLREKRSCDIIDTAFIDNQ